jgi:hypothetical protein
MSIPWCPMDTAQLYMKNRIKNIKMLKQNGWMNNTFDYSFNSKGFRCKEFTSDPTIMFLGCSYTCGIGLPVETIWPELVAKSLKMKCANLGQGAGSCDTAFRLCLGYIDKIKPKIVIFLQPPNIRWELVSKNNINLLGIWAVDKISNYKSYIQDYSIDENNNYFNSYKNILAVESLCEKRQIKFLHFDSYNHGKSDLARDLVHPGIEANLQFSTIVLSKL